MAVTYLLLVTICLSAVNSQYCGKPCCKSQAQMLSEILASPNGEKALDVLKIAAGIRNGVYPGACGCNTCTSCGCGCGGCSCSSNGCGCSCGCLEDLITIYNREVYPGTPFAQPVNCPCAGIPYTDIYPFLPNYKPAPIKSCQQAVKLPPVYSSVQQVVPGATQVALSSAYPELRTAALTAPVIAQSASVFAPSTGCGCQSVPTALVNPLLPAQSPVSAIAPPTSNLFPPMTPKCFKSNFLRKIPIPPPCI